MNALNVRVVPKDWDDEETVVESPGVLSLAPSRLAGPVRRAIARTRQWLLDEQHPQGYWVGELEGDSILESEYVLLLAYLGEADSPRARQAARYLMQKQLPGGGWAMYPDGPLEISASVKAYFALKLTGHEPQADYMQRAREAILGAGGADRVNSFTRFYLALLGQISYEQCPAVPPELALLPKWFPVNLYAMSAWTRTIVVPLSIISACQPVTRVAPHLGIRELFLKAPADWPELRCPGMKESTGWFTWERFFRTTDKLLKRYQRSCGDGALRKRAISVSKEWMLARFAGSEGLGAIFPPMVWSIVALKSLGYADGSPEMKYCRDVLDGLIVEENAGLRLQPCKSPVWDTAIALRAVLESGASPASEAARRATEWLLDQQIDCEGDWCETVAAPSGGWCFEHANDFYPDVDDTAMVLLALQKQIVSSPEECESLPPGLRLLHEDDEGDSTAVHEQAALVQRTAAAAARGEAWMLAMQNKDGGWGAFDKDNDREFLCHVPFADHNAMLDPSTPDLTARVLESLGALGRRVGNSAVDRALAYIRTTQEPDGSWSGRWGVNYVYGTWQVLTGLAAAGVPADDPLMVSGANWLMAYQQSCGGWGESPASYDDPSLRGQGPVTASQTAWAVLGLIAAGLERHPAVLRGVRFLVSEQNEDGSWDEPEFTGTGFPRVFYLRYHLYRIYFPLLALSRFATS